MVMVLPQTDIWRRRVHVWLQRLATVVCAGAMLAVILSLPISAQLLVQPLQQFPALSLQELSDLSSSPATAIVVLSAGTHLAPEFPGGNTVDALSLERIRYAAYVARRTALPVLLSGGIPPGTSVPFAALMEETMVQDFALTPKWLEERSQTTAGNAIFSAQILKENGIERVVLVTHAWHMARARRAFIANGIAVIAAPTSFYGISRLQFPLAITPSMNAFRMSGYALHEIIGIFWYRIRYGY